MKETMASKLLLMPMVAAGLSACSIFGGSDKDDIVFDVRTGPNTRALVEDLPDGLVGDRENAVHTTDQLRADPPSD